MLNKNIFAEHKYKLIYKITADQILHRDPMLLSSVCYVSEVFAYMFEKLLNLYTTI